MIYADLTPNGPRAVVRSPFTQCAVWRDAVGPSIALLLFAIDGNLDAPQNIPTGCMIAGMPGVGGRNYAMNDTLDREHR